MYTTTVSSPDVLIPRKTAYTIILARSPLLILNTFRNPFEPMIDEGPWLEATLVPISLLSAFFCRRVARCPEDFLERAGNVVPQTPV